MLNDRDYGDFTIENLFSVIGTTSTDAKNVSFTSLGDSEFIGRTQLNYGVQGLVNSSDFNFPPNLKNTITISQVGTIVAQYRNKQYYTSQNIVRLSNPKLTKRSGLFIVAVLNSWLTKSGFNGYITPKQSVIRQASIELPLLSHADPNNYSQSDIDWQFMEKFIKELEAERIQELEAYLLATGLTNYHIKGLTLESRTWGTFKNDDLFEKCSLKRLKKTFDKKNDLSTTRTKEYNLPLVNAKAGNNGIMYYGRECDWESEELTLDVVSNGAISTGMVYAQPQRTGTLWDAYQIRLKDRVPTYRQLLFLQRCLQTNIQLKFNYYNKATWEKVKHETIDLPLKNSSDSDHYSKSDIDWQFMEDFICDLEAERIQNLKAEFIQEQEAYLIASGLTNCHLKR